MLETRYHSTRYSEIIKWRFTDYFLQGRTTDKVVKVKKEPTEKKTPAKRTSAKRNSASNTAATKTPGKATAKAAVIENTEDLTVAANLVVSMEPDVIIRNFQASIDNERFDHADLDATIAFECV